LKMVKASAIHGLHMLLKRKVVSSELLIYAPPEGYRA
jgi:hypothetical protein